MKPTLFVMAAGMGSRYGGLKQMDGLGPNGETIIDYSIYDAIRAGFETVVFVIKHEIEDAFKEAMADAASSVIDFFKGNIELINNFMMALAEEQIKAAFELRYASELGFMPDMDGCSICGGTPTGAVLHIERGNLVCKDCRGTLEESLRRDEAPHESLVALLTPATISAIAYITSAPLERLFSFKLEQDELSLLGMAAEEYLLYHTDHIYTSLEFYKQVCD